MQRVTYICDAEAVDNPCGKETGGYYMLVGREGKTVRHDLCDYHMHVIYAALQGQIRMPRDPAEAACP